MKKIFLLFLLFFTTDSLASGSCGIGNLDTSIDGIGRGYTNLNGSTGTNESNYGLTVGSGQWAAEFDYGVVWGMANCNSVKGASNTVDIPTLASSGKHCWCQVTGFTASGNSYTSGPQCTTTASDRWMYILNPAIEDASSCATLCTSQCSQRFLSSASNRQVCLDTLPKVNLTWYDNDTQMSGISSCVLGDTFLPPTPDPRPGYVFTGWKIKPREKCGIDSLVDVGVDVTSTGYAQLDGSTGENESNYGLTTAGQWAVESSYGTVYGMANCNSVKGTAGKVGLPDTATSGRYCWCQVTGFTASGNSYTSGPRCTTYISSSWMYVSSSSNCMSTCASTCRTNFSNNASYRTAMFNAVGQ